jgi:voltage-gated potassium channel
MMGTLSRSLRSRVLRRRWYDILDGGAHSRLGIVLHRILIVLVIASVLAVVLETVPSLQVRYGRLFDVVEYTALVCFTLEYLARLWAAPEHPPLRHMKAWRARVSYAMSPSALVDLLAILPFYLAMVIPGDLRVFVLFRLLRFFKLARYSPGMRSLLEAIYAERRSLMACLVVMAGLILVSAAIMHIVEHEAQPDKLGTIPDAMYWAVITLGTIGYGDIVPVTPLGKGVAAVTAMFGLVMFAMPVGIIATAFAQAIQRRDFVVTWSMVARVPLFSELAAAEIADIMRYLHSQSAEAGEVIVRRGDMADSMYFIASGEVEIDLPHHVTTMGEGHFFGEIAVLRRSRRTATVRALTHVRLLVLEAADLQSLMERRPSVAEIIERVAKERLVDERIGRRGDLVSEEIEKGSSP